MPQKHFDMGKGVKWQEWDSLVWKPLRLGPLDSNYCETMQALMPAVKQIGQYTELLVSKSGEVMAVCYPFGPNEGEDYWSYTFPNGSVSKRFGDRAGCHGAARAFIQEKLNNGWKVQLSEEALAAIIQTPFGMDIVTKAIQRGDITHEQAATAIAGAGPGSTSNTMGYNGKPPMGLVPPSAPVNPLIKVKLAPVAHPRCPYCGAFVPSSNATCTVCHHAAVADTRPQIIRWSLHTLKGQPVLKLDVRGEKYYKHGETVSNRDFADDGAPVAHTGNQSDEAHKFRGKIEHVAIVFDADTPLGASQVRQKIEIAIWQHALIDSGKYKPKGGVLHSPYGYGTTTNLAGTLPSPKPSYTPPPIQPLQPKRKFNLDD